MDPVIWKKPKLEFANSPFIDNINSRLNNDCLSYIFDYLPVIDKLRIGLVCKRWKHIGSKVRSFEIDAKLREETNLSDPFNFIISVIRNCGPQINKLTVDSNYQRLCNDANKKVLFKEISIHCRNLTHFEIKGNEHINQSYIGALFKKNKKISSVTLSNIFLNGTCLSKLNVEAIVELNLNCMYHSVPHIEEFFPKLKNLKIIGIGSRLLHLNEIIIALNKSNCENLHEFSLDSNLYCASELNKFLSKQKNLRKICLKKMEFDRIFYENLRECPLEELTAILNQETSFSLRHFKNLSVLTCWIRNLNDEIITYLTKCENLKKLKFSFSGNFLINQLISNSFAKFKNIESLTFVCVGKNIDNILYAITNNYNNIRELNLLHCEVSEIGLNSIFYHKNLVLLKICINSIRNIMKLSDLVKELFNLKEIYLYGYREYDYTFFENINDAKFMRGDKNVLKMYIHDWKLNVEHYQNIREEFYLLHILNWSKLDPVDF